ncbi:DUF6779 domain-containing protein [Parasphingorhabdus pacifica]
MSDLDGSEDARGGGRATPLWVGAAVLAAAATAVLVLSDDARLLKLGLVAALWAALISAFAVAKLRNRVADDADREAEMQRVYELELEREVAARREFEAEAEAEARRRAAEDSAHEIQSLRAELNNLRQTLEQVVGGDVLFERVALRAESTRVRALGDQSGRTASSSELRPVGEWERELPGGNGVSGQAAQFPAGPAVASNGAVPNQPAAGQAAAGQPAPSQAAAGQPAPSQAVPGQPAPNTGRPQNSPAAGQGVPGEAAARAGSTGPNTIEGHSVSDTGAEQSTEMFPRVSGEQPADRPSAADRSSAADRQHPVEPQRPAAERPATAPVESESPRAQPIVRGVQMVNGSSGKSRRPAPAADPARSRPPKPGGSRTRTDSQPQPEAVDPSRATEGWPEPPADQSAAQSAAQSADRQASQDSSHVVEGAHAEGTSVTELLAAYGESNESQRRRRRRG